MTSLGRGVAALGGSVAVLLVGAIAPAYAEGDTFQECVDRAADHDGQLPTCTQVPGEGWVATWPGDGGLSGGGGDGEIVSLFLLAIVVAVAITAWKVSTARRLARQSGIDEGLATRMTLLSDDGLDATYLAASLRQPAEQAPPVESPTSTTPDTQARTTTERLVELATLREQELITAEEYEARRRAIIDSV